MKKTLLLLFMAILSAFYSRAQIYHPLLSDTMNLKVMTQGMIGPFYQEYGIRKDTVIGAHTYKKIAYLPNDGYPTYLREDSVARKVYGIVAGTDQLIYDFSLNRGDSVYLHWVNGMYGASYYNGYYVVDSVSYISTLAGPRKLMHLTSGSYLTEKWLEGVGDLNNFINYPITFCDIPDCGVFYTPYCQTRNSVQTWERAPLFSCSSDTMLYDCRATVNYNRSDSDYVFNVTVNGPGPHTYKWICYLVDSQYHAIDSSFYPNAHFVLPLNKVYYISVTALDTFTFGCSAASGISVHDSTLSVNAACNAFFYMYPGQQPGEYYSQNLSIGNNLSYTWDFGDGSAVSHFVIPQHTYTTPGRYTVCLTVDNGAGCTSTYCDGNFYDYKFGGGPMSVLNPGANSIEETGADVSEGIAVYPNPANGLLNIQFLKATQATTIQVYDVNGERIEIANQKNGNGYNLDVHSLPSGVYCVVINRPQGRLVKRFIKE